MNSWIVYVTPEGKVDAILDDHKTAGLWIFNNNYEILGYPAMKTKKDAIEYLIYLRAQPKRKPRGRAIPE
jgi:hypothetical protein